MATGAERQAALKARRQAAGLQLVANLWARPEDVPAIKALAVYGASSLAVTLPNAQVVGSKTISDPTTETTEQLCASLAWQFSQLSDDTYRSTGQGVINRILKTLNERVKHGHYSATPSREKARFSAH